MVKFLESSVLISLAHQIEIFKNFMFFLVHESIIFFLTSPMLQVRTFVKPSSCVPLPAFAPACQPTVLWVNKTLFASAHPGFSEVYKQRTQSWGPSAGAHSCSFEGCLLMSGSSIYGVGDKVENLTCSTNCLKFL